MPEANLPTHRPVLPEQIVSLGFPPNGKVFVDGTFGLGGHSKAMLERHPQIERVLGLDRDAEILDFSKSTLADPRVERIHARASDLAGILQERGLAGVDGILLDIGVSSYQLDTPERGFSFMRPGPLDMRMDRQSRTSAADVVNTASVERLTEVFFTFGEERLARRIAEAIVRIRETKPFSRTEQLAELVSSLYPARLRRESGIHPATRVFQALRILVNQELEELQNALDVAINSLLPKGRIAVISFHSLEDRIVKQTFARAIRPCTCPPKFPICICQKKPVLKAISHKPITADLAEIAANPRSRSAKLRVAEKLP